MEFFRIVNNKTMSLQQGMPEWFDEICLLVFYSRRSVIFCCFSVICVLYVSYIGYMIINVKLL